MILALLFCIALLFLIAVVFYRHRQKDLSILQIEASLLDSQFAELLEEKQPIVLRGITPPKGLSKESLIKTHRLQNFPIGGQPLGLLLQTPSMLASSKGLPTLSYEGSTELAKEISLPVWADQLWKTRFSEMSWLGSFLGCMKTEACIGGVGMTRTIANYTCIFPTEGTYSVSILSQQSEPFLPTNWQYKYPSSLSLNDTPLVAELKYIDIILRPGSALCLPSHLIYSMEPTDPVAFSSFAILEYHESISLLTKMIYVKKITLPSLKDNTEDS
jgi:hypothetical protein